MTLTSHSLSPKTGSRTKKFRIGRGPGTGRGKTAGRGTKGQRARTGGRKNLKLKGLKQMILGFPKLRGFQSRSGKAATVTLGQLSVFSAGSTVDLSALRRHGLASRMQLGAKIVSGGACDKALTITGPGVNVSASAREAIEKAGGKVH